MKLTKASFCLLLVLLLFSLPGTAAGLEIQTSVIIESDGEAIIYHDCEVNTEASKSGLKYQDEFYTPALGLWGGSEINYSSELSVVASDIANSTINVDSVYEMTNIRQKACLRSYPLLSLQSYWNEGDMLVAASFAADNSTASMDIAEELIGKGGYKIKVLNSSNRHVKEYLDRTDYMGEYSVIVIGSYIGESKYPASMMDDSWLSCPGGANWICGAEEP